MEKHIHQKWNFIISELAYTLLNWSKYYQKSKNIYMENDLSRNKKELQRWVYGNLQEVGLTSKSGGVKPDYRIAVREHNSAPKLNDMCKR